MEPKPSTSKEIIDEEVEDEETEELTHLTDFTLLAGDVTPHLTAKHHSLVHGTVTKETAIATHSALIFALSPDKEQQIREFYDRLDIDHDGTIDIRDLTQALKHENSLSHIPTNLAPAIMSQMSKDDDGKVGFVEFANYVLDHEQKLAEMFATMDRNNDGVIDVWELRHYCMDNGMSLDKQQAQLIVNKMDQSGNGTFIGLNEFVNYMILYPSNDIKEIVDFWRHAMIFDIGEDVLVPEDFSAQEIKEGIWWRHLVAGGIAGTISRTFTAPFDRLKVYLQVNSSKTNNMGLLSCIKLLHAEGGMKSFWRGNGINVIKIAPESAIKFMCYEEIKRLIQRNKNPDDDITLLERLFAGSSAGAISQSIIYPMEVMKTRLALRRTGQMDRGIIHFAHKMYTKEGIRSFYKGYWPNLIGIIPYAGIDLAIYETLKRMYLKNHETSEPSVFALLVCGTCSSTCGQLASYPFALVRTRLQARTVSRHQIEADTMFGQFRDIYKNEGLLGFYRGITPNFMKVIPAFGCKNVLIFSGLLEYLMGVRVRVSGDEIEFGRPALIIMNHRTRLDWMYMWCALYQVNPWLITTNKISLKAQLKKLPGAGFGMAAAQFVFLERNAEVDRKSFDDAIDYFPWT
ncbi:unnamed protein product [Caenorhabditis angaria]|uniref:EF-hand domain-containing protein n=1 Tax=Caenorhabditis angaria TaxID=860376 RepID=A0A9P1IRU9_9PELO|nr:unnamed protein product [Caenorhabditis angaria]